ncbi:hypothetical protein [uncultured Muribaculum sp.]|uniref:hypothetical protein n=1 Tax=uncultured Muribaculum sp. TaxID=1918613 RepID=UPI00272F91BD|nr:hypothetical protein [uncultured Muribaculum sp.]
MATDRIIPNRPIPDESKIPAADKDLISYVVAMGVPNQVAYARFHPEFLDASGKLNKTGRGACTQFFTYAKNKEYADAYRRTLTEFLGRKDAEIVDELEELTEERKEKASKLLMLEVIKMIEAGKISDPEFAKLVTDLAIKMKITKEDVERIIAPIRVLMTRCSECRYRIGVESMVLNGQMLDMCAYCKCRKIAEEHGYRFNDGKDLLEIPKEIIDELESKNNVKLEDILSGKVEN